MFMGVVLLTKNLLCKLQCCMHSRSFSMIILYKNFHSDQCLRKFISILLSVSLAWFLSILAFLFKCTLAIYVYACVHVDIYIYGNIILPFIIFNMNHTYTKRKLVCQVATTHLSYVTTTTIKIDENAYILFKQNTCLFLHAWNFTTCLLHVRQLRTLQTR